LWVASFRIFYDLEEENEIVKIEAVGYKQGNVLFIRGEEYRL
jgi:mRNA-degrading endonuclease RelE of RelBE toxin-antitoxin system